MQQAWLDAYRNRGTILSACQELGIDRSTVRLWRRDEKFEACFQDADEDITEQLERSALKDAIEGNTILKIFLLKARRPNKYRDNATIRHEGAMTIKEIILSDDGERKDKAEGGKAQP